MADAFALLDPIPASISNEQVETYFSKYKCLVSIFTVRSGYYQSTKAGSTLVKRIAMISPDAGITLDSILHPAIPHKISGNGITLTFATKEAPKFSAAVKKATPSTVAVPLSSDSDTESSSASETESDSHESTDTDSSTSTASDSDDNQDSDTTSTTMSSTDSDSSTSDSDSMSSTSESESESESESDSDSEPVLKKGDATKMNKVPTIPFVQSQKQLHATRLETPPSSESSMSDSEDDVKPPPTKVSKIEEPAPIHQGNRQNSGSGIPFKRVDPSKVFVDEKLKSNKFEDKSGAFGSYGHKAHNDLSVTRGKGFRQEKNKKKKGSYYGGYIDTGVHSVKFDSD
jgi:hypothetical protein